jgi:large subunit ribosomal protein L15
MLNEIRDNEGAHKRRMRVGRGIGSGKGKTCGRGGKGQTARTGVRIKGFEGGQMPIHRRLPKRGFNQHKRIELAIVNLGDLQKAVDAGKLDAAKVVTHEILVAAGIARANEHGIKLLSKGALKAKLTIDVTRASKAAIEAVEKAGGSVKVAPEKESAPKKKSAEKK